MPKVFKKPYSSKSHFVRTALDFANDHWNYSDFGSDFKTMPAESRVASLRLAAMRMFDLGYVNKAYLHFNSRHDYAGGGHEFRIFFEKLPSGLAPSIGVNFLSEEELRKRAKFYKGEASIGIGIRKPKPKALGEMSRGPL